jgi:hypothetical protein
MKLASTRKLAVAATAAMLAAGACSSSASHSPRSGGIPKVDEAAANWQFPLDSYRPTGDDLRALTNAQFTLATRCAREHGVQVTFPRATSTRNDFSFLYSFNLRPLTAAEARTYGFGLPPSQSSPADAVVSRLSAPQQAVLTGWSKDSGLPRPKSTLLLTGGCFGAAARTLNGDGSQTSLGGILQADRAYVQNAISNIGARVLADPSVQGRIGKWAACMHAAGYSGFSSPPELIRKVQAAPPTTSPIRREALQDVACKQSSGLVKAWVTTTKRFQQDFIERNSQQLQAVSQRLTAATRRAATVVGS